MNTDVMDIKQIEQESNQLVIKAQQTQIANNTAYIEATDFLKTLKAMQNEVKSAFDPIVQKAYAAHKESVVQKDKYLKPLLKAEDLIKQRISTFLADQERLRLEQERKLQAEADKKRQEALDKAAAARANGKEAQAEKYENKANGIIAPTLSSNVAEVSGVRTCQDWDFEITDVNAIPREYLVPDEIKIRAVVKATKGTLPIAGVRIFPKTVVVAGVGKPGSWPRIRYRVYS